MIKGAIFDLDGTILDSMFIWDTIGEDYLRSLGIADCCMEDYFGLEKFWSSINK